MDADKALESFVVANERDLGRLMVAATAELNRRALHDLDPHGVSGIRAAHIPLIASLDPAGSRLVDIAQRMGVTRQAVAHLAQDLADSGVVTISPDPSDGRASRVLLTDAGAAFCAAAAEYIAEREQRWRDELGSDAIDAVRAFLMRLAPADAPVD